MSKPAARQARCSLNLTSSLLLAPYDGLRRVGIHRVIGSPTAMKTKTSKQPKQPKPNVQLKDIKPKKEAKGGTRYYTGVNAVLSDGSVRF